MATPATLKSLFSSKLRVKVVDHFFFHPGEAFYVRRLTRELHEPAGTVARELAHLEQAGLLAPRRQSATLRAAGSRSFSGMPKRCRRGIPEAGWG